MNEHGILRSASLALRIAQAPPLADRKRAGAKLAELVERAEEGAARETLSPHLQEGEFSDVLLAIADHSTFLWQLALADPFRLARLATHPP